MGVAHSRGITPPFAASCCPPASVYRVGGVEGLRGVFGGYRMERRVNGGGNVGGRAGGRAVGLGGRGFGRASDRLAPLQAWCAASRRRRGRVRSRPSSASASPTRPSVAVRTAAHTASPASSAPADASAASRASAHSRQSKPPWDRYYEATWRECCK